MTLDLAGLRAKAKAATEGPWFVNDFTGPEVNSEPTARDVYVSCTWPDHIPVASMGGGLHGFKGIEQARLDASFVAAANPTTILALLDRLERAETKLDTGSHSPEWGVFKPCAIYWEHDDSLEFITRDASTVSYWLGDHTTAVLSMDGSEPLGFRIEGVRAFMNELGCRAREALETKAMINRETLARKLYEDPELHFEGRPEWTARTQRVEKAFLQRADDEIARFSAMGLAVVPVAATARMAYTGMMATLMAGIDDFPGVKNSSVTMSPVIDDVMAAKVWTAMLKAAGEVKEKPDG